MRLTYLLTFHPYIYFSCIYALTHNILNEPYVLRWDIVELDERLTFIEEPVSILAIDVR